MTARKNGYRAPPTAVQVAGRKARYRMQRNLVKHYRVVDNGAEQPRCQHPTWHELTDSPDEVTCRACQRLMTGENRYGYVRGALRTNPSK